MNLQKGGDVGLGEYGTHKTVKARSRPLISGKSPQTLLNCSLFARRRTWKSVQLEQETSSRKAPDPGKYASRSYLPTPTCQQERQKVHHLHLCGAMCTSAVQIRQQKRECTQYFANLSQTSSRWRPSLGSTPPDRTCAQEQGRQQQHYAHNLIG